MLYLPVPITRKHFDIKNAHFTKRSYTLDRYLQFSEGFATHNTCILCWRFTTYTDTIAGMKNTRTRHIYNVSPYGEMRTKLQGVQYTPKTVKPKFPYKSNVTRERYLKIERQPSEIGSLRFQLELPD